MAVVYGNDLAFLEFCSNVDYISSVLEENPSLTNGSQQGAVFLPVLEVFGMGVRVEDVIITGVLQALGVCCPGC